MSFPENVVVERMTDLQWREFVSTGTRTGKLAIVRRSGRPHVTPVWFLLRREGDGVEVVFTTWSDSVKGRTLQEGVSFAVCVDEEQPPYSYVMLQCVVRTVHTDTDEIRPWATRIAERYMGADQAAAYGQRNSVAGELLIVGAVDSVTALSGIAD
jgi:PPOX class probable F420-dependent enzyme